MRHPSTARRLFKDWEPDDPEQFDEALARQVARLPDQPRQVIELYDQGLTFDDIADRLGLTRDRVRQLHAAGLRTLRHPARGLRRLGHPKGREMRPESED